MPLYEGFIGPTAPEWSSNYGTERLVNWYLHRGSGHPKYPWCYYPTPGIRPWCVGLAGPVRGLFEQDGLMFGVAGNTFYQFDNARESFNRGTVALDEWPVTMDTNGTAGHQIFVVSAGVGYIYDINTAAPLTAITDPEFLLPALNGAFIDGYFVNAQKNSITFQLSALEDGLSWNGLDEGQSNQTTDRIRRIFVNHQELWIFGGQRTTVWVDTGNPSFPLAPLPGATIQQGIVAPWSVVPLDNSFLWLGANEEGQGVVYRPEGYRPKRVSTSAIEQVWRQYARIDNAVAWSYQMDGHYFYVLVFPDAGPIPTSWVYDTSTDQWHERAHWSTTLIDWVPYRPGSHCFAFGKHLVGDRLTGTIYEMSNEFYSSTIAVSA